MFAFLVLAIHVEHGAPVILLRTQVFGVQVCYLRDFLTALQQRVQETDEQILVDFRAKEFLECEIRVEIDVSFINAF